MVLIPGHPLDALGGNYSQRVIQYICRDSGLRVPTSSTNAVANHNAVMIRDELSGLMTKVDQSVSLYSTESCEIMVFRRREQRTCLTQPFHRPSVCMKIATREEHNFLITILVSLLSTASTSLDSSVCSSSREPCSSNERLNEHLALSSH